MVKAQSLMDVGNGRREPRLADSLKRFGVTFMDLTIFSMNRHRYSQLVDFQLFNASFFLCFISPVILRESGFIS